MGCRNPRRLAGGRGTPATRHWRRKGGRRLRCSCWRMVF